MGGRAPSRCTAGDCYAITESGRKIRRCLPQDLVGLLQLPVLAFQRLQLLGHLGGDAAAIPAINLGFLDPLVQCLRRATDLRGNRQDRRPAALMLPGIVQNQANRAFRTSGEYLLVVLLRMLHPTQELEPPTNPARFKIRNVTKALNRMTGLGRAAFERV